MARIHSFESFGTVDGPGVRFVVFMQGCPLRCKYCHNPDTWEFAGGKEYSALEVKEEIIKYKNYIKDGGVTISGGEPLAQIDFVIELFKMLKKEGLHTCVDTSGILFDETKEEVVKKYEELLTVCDLFLLDIKHIQSEKHKELTGFNNEHILAFAKFLQAHHKPMWVRHVLVDGYTNEEVYLHELRKFLDTLDNVEKVEILPYHTLGLPKYEKMGITYPLLGVQSPSKEAVEKAKAIVGVKNYVK